MVGALVLTVAGCSGSGSDQPKVLPPVPSATVAVTPTPTTTAAPVVVPSAAVPATPQGAAAFVRFFYGELNGAFQDGNAQRIRVLSDPGCATCNNYAKATDASAKTQHYIVGDSFASLQVEAAPAAHGVTLVIVLGVVPARRVSDNGVVTTLPSDGSFANTVAVQRRGNQWLIRAIRFDKT